MPFTPFHFGPALFLGLALAVAFDLPTLLVASVIPDIEPFYILYFQASSSLPLHGFFHTYLGSSILAVSLALVLFPFRGWVNKIMGVFRLSQKSSFKKILFTSFVGVYFHVFLDSFLYQEMKPFYPLQGNPFINLFNGYNSYSVIYGFCGITALLSIALYFYRIRKGVAVLG